MKHSLKNKEVLDIKVVMFVPTEAVTVGVLWKKVFLKISQNSF